MSALALHLPERQGVGRWLLAAALIIAVHVAILASAVLWYARKPAVPDIIPAIAVTLAPVESSSPEIQDQDLAVGPTMQQAEAAPQPPPKIEDKPVEQEVTSPTPPHRADVALPDKEPKPVEAPKPEAPPPAPETRAPPKDAHVGAFTAAGSNAYNALILGHFVRFKRYPAAAHGAKGKVIVRFVLDRSGKLVSSEIVQSSGNDLFDREAIETLRRASPFPAFPSVKPGGQDSWTIPVTFG
ncbi:MAG: energy transducer TonB [Bradyrhizobium sp.]|uniref:energy transducer TonB family protein n=1 Tax=Bradyrhizobium sp. TaxID=376 RepID=UPI001DAE86B3|nr:energy transducer TonB [Bradyrhizobium sp.]MBV9563883.1 energy transducer TonB [Bradyrhizobium sp.]